MVTLKLRTRIVAAVSAALVVNSVSLAVNRYMADPEPGGGPVQVSVVMIPMQPQ